MRRRAAFRSRNTTQASRSARQQFLHDDVTAGERLGVAALVQVREQRVVLGDVVGDDAETALNGGGDDVADLELANAMVFLKLSTAKALCYGTLSLEGCANKLGRSPVVWHAL